MFVGIAQLCIAPEGCDATDAELSSKAGTKKIIASNLVYNINQFIFEINLQESETATITIKPYSI